MDAETDNPYAGVETAIVLRNALDTSLGALWPVTHSNFGHALEAGALIMTHTLRLFDAPVGAAAWELSVIYSEVLNDPDYDISSIIGADIWAEESDATSAVVYAFIAEAIAENHPGAIQVLKSFVDDYREDEEEAARQGLSLIVFLMVALSYQYSSAIIEGADDDDSG